MICCLICSAVHTWICCWKGESCIWIQKAVMDLWREELPKILSFLLCFWPCLHLSQISEVLTLTLVVFSIFGLKNCISLQVRSVRIKECQLEYRRAATIIKAHWSFRLVHWKPHHVAWIPLQWRNCSPLHHITASDSTEQLSVVRSPFSCAVW